MTTIEVIPEAVIPGMRLGRHVEHDPASRAYAATTRRRKPVSRRWARRSPILSQGDLGSCTGNTGAGWLACDTKFRKGRTDVDEDLAVQLYSAASHLDRIPGGYLPEDTGSTGLAVAKALVKGGHTTGPYKHTFSTIGALLALSEVGPLVVGITWREGMDTPDKNGLCRFAGAVRGGHEQLWTELDVEKGLVWFDNSWGPDWAIEGRACLTIADFELALADQGDVVVISG